MGFLVLLLASALAGVAAGGRPATPGRGEALAQERLVSQAFDHFYNLEFDEAIERLHLAAEQAPDSPDIQNHLAMSILYRDMLRAGALETELVTGNNPFLRRPKVEASPEEQRAFDDAIRKAMALAWGRLREDPRDTRALYALGVSYGLRANYNFIVRKAWRDALHDATTARRNHNRVTEIDPSFVDARLVQGLHDFVIGSLPLGWRMLGFLIGFHGDKEQGIRSLQLVAAKGVLNRTDAEVWLCAVYRRERQPQKALALLNDLMRRYPRNYLFPMELSQMYSDLGDKANALAALDRVEQMCRTGKGASRRVPIERVYFARGTIQFWYGDLDEALANMRRAASAAEDLDLNTGVLSWMRLGQIHDLRGERQQAIEAYRHAIAFAPDSDAARESRRYLENPYTRRRNG